MRQIITIELTLKPGQRLYGFHEQKFHQGKPYNALKHFFEDIGFSVTKQTSKTKADTFPWRRTKAD